jgi:hypothetical protein
MALTEENGGGNGMVMPVAPMYGGGSGFGGGWGGDSGWWIILLFLFALGGWGNNGWGGNGGGGAMPYIMNSTTDSAVQRGFDQQAVMSGISGLQSGISGLSTQLCNSTGDIQQSLCNGFAGVNATVNSGFANAETAANARQMANMNQMFGAQTAMMQGFNNIGSQFADCCCEQRLGTADLKYTIATENCADRAAVSDGIRDLLANQTANTQRILDQLCQDKIDAKNETIAQLRQELMYSRGQASQVEQTAQLLANNNAQTALFQQGLNNEVDALYNRLSACPVPTVPVYGRQPIFSCNNNCGCGCGGNTGLV